MPDSPDSPSECCRPLFALLLILAVRRGRGCAPIFSDCSEIQASQRIRPDSRKETARHAKREAQTTWATERFEVQTTWAAACEMPMVLSMRLLLLLPPAFLLIAFAQGKRTRCRVQRFEDKQAATRVQEGEHNLKKCNKKYANLKNADELATSKSDVEDCTSVRGTPVVCTSSNLRTARQAKEARKRRHAPLAAYQRDGSERA